MVGYYARRNKKDGYGIFFVSSVIKEKQYKIIDLGDSRLAQQLNFSANNVEISIVNTKVAWTPYNKQQEPYLGLDQIRSIFKKPYTRKTILVGDLNCAPQTVIPDFLSKLGMRDVFASPQFTAPTVWANSIPQRVDYVFATRDLTVHPVPEDYSKFQDTIPSDKWPSDHAWLRFHVHLNTVGGLR